MIIMKFVLLTILILLFYFFNQNYINEPFSLIPEETPPDNVIKQPIKSSFGDSTKLNGDFSKMTLLPEQRPDWMIKKPIKSSLGGSTKSNGDFSKMTLFPENKPGDVVPKFFNISLKSDKNIASVNHDCKYGCEFTCLDDSDCLINGDFNAIPNNNDTLKKEVVFNTLYEANFKKFNQKQKWSDIRNIVLLNNTNYNEDPAVERIIDHNQENIKKKYKKARLDKNELEAKIRQARFSKKFIGKEKKRWKRINELKKRFKKKNREIKSRIKNNHFRDKLLKKICDKNDGFRFARLHKVLKDSYDNDDENNWVLEEEIPDYINQTLDDNKNLLKIDHWLPFLDLNKSRCIEYLKSVH